MATNGVVRRSLAPFGERFMTQFYYCTDGKDEWGEKHYMGPRQLFGFGPIVKNAVAATWMRKVDQTDWFGRLVRGVEEEAYEEGALARDKWRVLRSYNWPRVRLRNEIRNTKRFREMGLDSPAILEERSRPEWPHRVLAFEFIKGSTPFQLYDARERSAGRAIGEYMRRAHDASIAFTDNKPQNYVVDKEGRVWRVDHEFTTKLPFDEGLPQEIRASELEQWLGVFAYYSERGPSSVSSDMKEGLWMLLGSHQSKKVDFDTTFLHGFLDGYGMPDAEEIVASSETLDRLSPLLPEYRKRAIKRVVIRHLRK